MVGIIRRKRRIRRRTLRPTIIRRTKVTGKTTGEIGKIARDKNKRVIKRIKKRIRKIRRRR